MKIFVALTLFCSLSLADIGKHLKSTAADAFDTQGLWILGVGATVTILATGLDQNIRDRSKDHQWMHESVSKVGEFWGSGVPEVGILGAQYFFDPENAVPGMEGLFLGNVAVVGLKYSVLRDRPDHSENVSFPSGHTQASFSLATSMSMSYGWKKALPFWGMAVLTGASRIADDKHWLSDVAAGATLGILFGRAGFQHHWQIIPNVRMDDGVVKETSFVAKINF